MRTFKQAYEAMSPQEKTEACDSLGVAKATLSRWASGERLPPIHRAIQIETVLGISLYSWTSKG
jgi:transcriptional regulator with XRE-family HTH domain